MLATLDGRAGGHAACWPCSRWTQGRTAVFCGDTTRNWQQGPRALDQESPFLRFWGQMVRWLAGRSAAVAAGAGITADTDKALYEPDEPIRISAVVRDQQGQAAAGATVSAKIRRPSGQPSERAARRGARPGGHYSGTFQSGETGQPRNRRRGPGRRLKPRGREDRRRGRAAPTWNSRSSTSTTRLLAADRRRHRAAAMFTSPPPTT